MSTIVGIFTEKSVEIQNLMLMENPVETGRRPSLRPPTVSDLLDRSDTDGPRRLLEVTVGTTSTSLKRPDTDSPLASFLLGVHY